MGKTKKGSTTKEASLEEIVMLKRRTRKGHRAYLKQVVEETKTLLEAYDTGQQLKAVQLKETLEEQLDFAKKIDEEILNILVQREGVADEEIAGDIRGEIKALLISLSDLARKSGVQASDSETSHPDPHANNESSTVRVRLPKLETKRFTGKVEEW